MIDAINTINKRLDKIEKQASEATPGPWVPSKGKRGMHANVLETDILGATVCDCESIGVRRRDHRKNAAFIAAARTDVPKLVAALRLAIQGLRRYAGREVGVGDGYCRLRYGPTPDAPSMCFYEGETWMLGEHADAALKDIAEKLR
jgi:hypothetical protein